MQKLLLSIGIILFVMGGPRAQSISEARKLLYYERYDGAAHQLQTLIKADPNNTEAWWLLTQAYLHQNRPQAIRDSLQYLPAAVAGQPFALCIRGQLALEQSRKDSANGYFSKALAMTKEKDPVILQAIAKAHQDADSGNAQYALELLDKAAKKDRKNPEIYVAEGDAYRKIQDGGQAFKAYQEALNQDSKYAKALYKQGKIFVTQNNAEQYLKYFNDAVAADSSYAPAWYELYYHYYFRDVNKAAEYLNHYIANTDPGVQNDYLVTDLLYSSRKYNEAIRHAQQLLGQSNTAEPRLYKLIAYSYKELHDSTKALDFMRQYFQKQADTGFVVKDYETMGEIYESLSQTDSAAPYFIKAASREQDSTKRIAYAKKLADLYKKEKNYSQQALWLGQFYQGNTKATNLDLFNWGLAHYMAKEYPMADSVFGLYETKYPDQDFGYYWRARSDVAIDTAMQTGMAIPHYEKLIEIAEKDTANKTNRKHLIEAYGYIAAYKANAQKEYDSAIAYFGKLLTLDPGNTDAQRYITILKKNLSKSKGTPNSANAEAKTEDK
ncbi:MAG TPA: tetratricopeptide repeat protein [Puia sp.]